MEEYPKLSDITQDETHGIIADLSLAIKNNESDESIKSCIMPQTNFDYEKSNNVANIKVLKDQIPAINIQNSTKSLLAANLRLDCRFKAFDQSVFRIYSDRPRDETYDLYHYMRIRQTQVYCGNSPQFKNIYIMSTVDSEANLIVFVPQKSGQITQDTMHDNIKNGLKSWTEQKNYAPGEAAIWIPQFKIGQDYSSYPSIQNFKVGEEQYVQEYLQKSAIELYAPPISQGNLQIEVDPTKDIVIQDREFFVAVTSTLLENSGIDLPLCVTKVTLDDWKKVNKA